MAQQQRGAAGGSQDEDKISRIEDRSVRIKASRLRAKLEQCNLSLKDAVQLARGFERQKLGRRQKQAESEPRTLLRLREEVIIIRELDPSKTAKDYLFKQLVKTKRIRESPTFVALYGENPSLATTKSAAEANVLGRLFKSNPVKEILPDIMQSIRDILNLGDRNSTTTRTSAVSTAEDRGDITYAPTSSHNHEEDTKNFTDFSDTEKPSSADVGRGLEGITLEEPSARGGVPLSESDDDDHDLAAYGDMIGGSSSDEDQDDDIGDVGNLHQTTTTTRQTERQVLTPSSSELDKSDQGVRKSQSKSEPAKRKTSEKISSTAFLPSLSMGGYYSGSDSDGDDNNNATFDRERGPAVPEARKNRRGQRARREIAEKKFGQNAKHLANQPQENGAQGHKGRDAGWDPRQGATDGRQGRKFANGRGGSRGIRSARGPTGANGDVINLDRAWDKRASNANRGHDVAATAAGSTSTKRKSEAPLHPSWEAARKKKLETGVSPFLGKKIRFD